MTQHKQHVGSDVRSYPVAAQLDHDGKAHPFPAGNHHNEPLGFHFSGRVTRDQWFALTGNDDPTPFLAYILPGPEGPCVYQFDSIEADLSNMAREWSIHTGQPHAPVPTLPDDADGIADLMDHIMHCIHRDDLRIDNECTTNHLSKLEPDILATLLVKS